jgi:hypothetical protein
MVAELEDPYLAGLDVEIVEGDMCDAAAVDRAMAGARNTIPKYRSRREPRSDLEASAEQRRSTDRLENS